MRARPFEARHPPQPVTESTTVTTGYSETIGKTIYAGPWRSASNSSSCPPAPSSPAESPNATDRRSWSSFQFAWRSATREASVSRAGEKLASRGNFDAGFVRAWLLGREVASCIELACRCGAASLAAGGGIQAQSREAILSGN